MEYTVQKLARLAGVTQMYVDDERFTAYYDERLKPGSAEFLRDAVFVRP